MDEFGSVELQAEARQVVAGDTVIFHLPKGDNGSSFESRPGIVVRVWNKETGYVNGVAFLDGYNDRELGGTSDLCTRWVTSYSYSETPNPYKWSWPS